MQARPGYVENVLQRLAELQRCLGNLNPRQRAELGVDIDRLMEDLRVLFSADDEPNVVKILIKRFSIQLLLQAVADALRRNGGPDRE